MILINTSQVVQIPQVAAIQMAENTQLMRMTTLLDLGQRNIADDAALFFQSICAQCSK